MSEKPTIVLIDYSSIAHPVYHATLNDPMPNAMSTTIIAKVRGLASGQPHVALCLDSRKSFRKELDATYKASRESKPEPFWHQYRLALETLKADGFPQWEAEGFEADDVVASGVEAAKVGAWPVLIVSSDKDLLALVNDHNELGHGAVRVKSPLTGNVMDAAAVQEKFGVHPLQIQDYLAIVGDASDGVVGVKGIGAKGAAALLGQFGNLDDLYAAMETGSEAVKPAQFLALQAFRERLPLVRQLLALRTDAPIDFAAVLKERVPDDVATFGEDEIMSDINEAMPTIELPEPIRGRASITDPASLAQIGTGRELSGDEASAALGTFVADVARRVAPKDAPQAPASSRVMTSSPVDGIRPSVPNGGDSGHSTAIVPVVVDYERELEPRNLDDVRQLSKWMFESRMFSEWGSPQAVMSAFLAGRELGFSAMASLRSFHVIKGKATLAADAIRAIVLKSGKAKSFRCTERTATAASFSTQRSGDSEPTTLRYTIEEAQAAGLVVNGSGWTKHPADMLVARASSKLARLVYPDVVAGLYAPEEME